ncbi:SCP-like extracellular protein [Bacillus sp. BRMEA1]|nr:SCP-like extracellular protein [Neobacillus endophyticus]
MLSAAQTTLNSNQYPHTSAVLIQDAKYQYVPIGSSGGNWNQSGMFQSFNQLFGQQGLNGGTTGQYWTPQQGQSFSGQAQTPSQQLQTVPGRTQTAPQQTAPNQIQPSTQPGQTANNTSVTGTVSQFVQQVINLTNAQRSQNGLPALKADSQLSSVAQRKAIDMQQNHYFSHTSPTYGSPFDMMRDFGVTYRSAGENIAQGQRTPQEVVTAWMNSPGHRANILNRNYTNIGVGFEATGKHWSQMFIGK